MGVDWITCDICGENFPDCGPCGYCSGCEANLCGTCHVEQVGKYGHPAEDSEAATDFGESAALKCDNCSGAIVHDAEVIDYLLAKVEMTRDQVVEEIKKKRTE